MSGRDFLRRTNAASLLASTALQPGVSADFLTEGATNKFIQATERLKLSGIEAGATANATNAQLRDRSTHTGTMSSDFLIDGTTNKVYTATEKTKLAGVASGATANSSDVQLRDRQTHTGEQAMSTITGLITALAAKATPADIANAIAALVASSPAALDTLDELANALGDDPNFATTVSTALGNRLRLDANQTLTAGQKTQGQTNLGVDPTTLDARYNRLSQVLADGQLPPGLRRGSTEVADADLAITNGFFSLVPGGLNGPSSANWAITVEVTPDLYVTQYARRYAGDSASSSLLYRRDKNGSVWSAWTMCMETQVELDARYANRISPQFSSEIYITPVTGAEGGQINLGLGSGQSALLGSVFLDTLVDRFRIGSVRASDGAFSIFDFNFSTGEIGTIASQGVMETRNRRGAANGYAPLGADNLIPGAYLPVQGSFKDNWNANTNSPALTTTPGPNGDYYLVSVAGTQSVTGTSTAFAIGDQLRSNGTAWRRIPSVNAVNSVFGRAGAIVAANGDYNAAQITYGATTVSAALDLLAPLSSPALTGTPTAPTAAAGTSTTQIATTAFVTAANNLKAPLASPAFTGSVAVLPAGGVEGGEINLGLGTAQTALTATVGFDTAGQAARIFGYRSSDGAARVFEFDFITGQITSPIGIFATLASPAFTGTPTAPTAALGTNTTQIATMAALKAAADTKSAEFDVTDGGSI